MSKRSSGQRAKARREFVRGAHTAALRADLREASPIPTTDPPGGVRIHGEDWWPLITVVYEPIVRNYVRRHGPNMVNRCGVVLGSRP